MKCLQNLVKYFIVLVLVVGIAIFMFFDFNKEFILQEKEERVLAIYLENEPINYIPDKESGYTLDLEKSSCNNGVEISFDYNTWTIKTNYNNYENTDNTRVKCTLYFREIKTIEETLHQLATVSEGTGLYEVEHSDADITFTTDSTIIDNLQLTELRFGGADPNNYVWFNDELWRIIGLVNTPEDQRIKIVRNEAIGRFSWDTSDVSINGGGGINEWSQADAMKLLNPGYESESIGGSLYYHRSSGLCYSNHYNETSNCDFSSIGLTENSHEFIDDITWTLGSNGSNVWNEITTSQFYDLERSNNVGKTCSSGYFCNDTVVRTTSWTGKVGLMYPSDYGYATGGGSATNRSTCLDTYINQWQEDNYQDCYKNNWLYHDYATFSIMPVIYSSSVGSDVYTFFATSLSYPAAYNGFDIIPVINLKIGINIVGGTGTIRDPYQLSI